MRQQLNLIDVQRLAVPVRPTLGTLALVVAVALLGVGAHFNWERSQYQKLMSGSAALPEQAPAEESAPDPAFDSRSRKVERDELLLAGLARATDLPSNSAGLLGQLTAALPDALWLTEVEFTGRKGLRISGGALDLAGLAVYANRLSDIAALGGVAIQVLTIEPRAAALEGADTDDPGAPASLPAHHHFVLGSETASASAGGPR